MKSVNYKVLFLFGSQVILSLIAAISGSTWQIANFDTHYYMGFTEDDRVSTGYLLICRLGTWMLIFTNFVPISLMVTLELVKVMQARFIEMDDSMID